MGGMAIKLVSPGNNGVSDRILILPDGKIWFVELKADGKEPTKLQRWQHERFRKLGCRVRTVRGMAEAQAFLEEVMTNEVPPARVPAARDR